MMRWMMLISVPGIMPREAFWKKAASMFRTILLIWAMLPIPKEARMAKQQKRTASTLDTGLSHLVL